MKDRLALLSPKERTTQNRAVCERLQRFLHDRVRGLCGYIALSDELDVDAFLRETLARGIPLFLPRYENGSVSFHAVTSLEELEREERFGLLQPHPALPQPDPDAVSHVLVPGRAFDPAGNRLGRGKGGYDRWIAMQRKAHPQTQCMGVAFTEQLLAAVPTEKHDARMDIVVTPSHTFFEDPFSKD